MFLHCCAVSADAWVSSSGPELFRALRYFWDFIHSDVADRSRATYEQFRGMFLTTWLRSANDLLTPAMHYMTNHLYEDYLNWGDPKLLVGEAGEAAHARDNRLKWGTLRGRRQTKYDAYNTWAILLRNCYAAHQLFAERVHLR